MPNLIINDDNFRQFLPGEVKVNGETVGHGLVPRDYGVYPLGYMGDELCPPMTAVDIPLIPRSEWSARCKEKAETKSRLSDIRRNMHGPGQHMKSLNQGQSNFCWTHSATGAVMILNGITNKPHTRLSAFAVACSLTGFQNNGGWGAWALEKIILSGIPDVSAWAERSMARSNDNPATWINAAKNKVTESWMDLTSSIYDRSLSTLQLATCLLSNIPVIGDYPWWRHSVLLLDWVEIEPGSFGPKGLNSWGDEWGDVGEFMLQGSKAEHGGATAPRVAIGG